MELKIFKKLNKVIAQPDYKFTDTDKVFFTSDLHFCHDREFIYKPRGFNNIEEMNESIVSNWNKVVRKNDYVFILGDLTLKDSKRGLEFIKKLNGKLIIILGNHDTDNRIELYQTLPNVIDICYATRIKYKKLHFYASHYPTFTGNLEAEKLYQCTIDLFGHTHSKQKFYNDIPFMINVALDAWNNTPVLLDTIIDEAVKKVDECKEML